MARNIIGLGALLTILGLGTFALVRFDPAQTVVLLPAGAGVLFMALGLTAFRHPERYRTALIVSVGLALLVMLISGSGFVDVYRMLQGTNLPYPTVALEQGVTVVLCGIFVVRALFAIADSFRQVEA